MTHMLSALIHAWHEGREAAAVAADAASARQLRADFFWSRLLRFGKLPSYNRPRRVVLKDGTVHYRFNRGDLQSLREVLIQEVYAWELPLEPRTVLDLGANIGLTSVWLWRRHLGSQTLSNPVKPWLLAVEPVLENAAVAEMNLRDNAISGAVLCAAVGQRSGEARFDLRAESNLGRVVAAESGAYLTRVPVVGIRELLDRFPQGRVDLVKMDIEGGEQELLGQDTDWLERVQALMVEWHDDRADSRPLIQNIVAAGFQHHRLNAARQENLSVFWRSDGRNAPSQSDRIQPNPTSL